MEVNNELNELRNRIAVLKQKLDKQEIVNDRVLRQAMQTTVDNVIKTVEIKALACGILGILLFPALHFTSGLRLPFCLCSSLIMLICMAATVYFNRPMHRTDLMSADLATVAKEMARFKRRHNMWLSCVAPTVIVPWLAWAYYELCLMAGTEPLSRYSIILGTSMLIGAVVGGAIGYSWHRKAVNAAESIIRQIEE
mgnify:CR=1 FL=1